MLGKPASTDSPLSPPSLSLSSRLGHDIANIFSPPSVDNCSPKCPNATDGELLSQSHKVHITAAEISATRRRIFQSFSETDRGKTVA